MVRGLEQEEVFLAQFCHNCRLKDNGNRTCIDIAVTKCNMNQYNSYLVFLYFTLDDVLCSK